MFISYVYLEDAWERPDLLWRWSPDWWVWAPHWIYHYWLLTMLLSPMMLLLSRPSVAPCLRPIRGQYPGHVITLDQSVTVLRPCLRHQSCSAQRARHTINLSLFVGLTFAKCCYQSMVTLNTMGIYTTWSLHHYCHNIKGHCKSIKGRYTRGTWWVGVLFL